MARSWSFSKRVPEVLKVPQVRGITKGKHTLPYACSAKQLSFYNHKRSKKRRHIRKTIETLISQGVCTLGYVEHEGQTNV